MKSAIVMTSFGTSAPQAQEDIAAVEGALAAAAPGYRCVRAFTSPTIRKILAGRGTSVPSMTQALERLRGEGTERVAVQPTHLLYGFEYDRLKTQAQAVAPGFQALRVGRPLLAGTEDILAFAGGLCQTYPAQEGGAVVFMGHGTGHFANAVYPALQTALSLRGREDLFVATVEGWPALEDWLPRLAGREVRLVPLMLVAGEHAKKDMAGGGPDSWKSRLEGAGCRVSCALTSLGRLDWVQQMYRQRLLETLSEGI
ncbi:MAG: sirohydrochlorin cobaltochelatase [Oscillospiraceae bacterium]|nr:sirohydrochlorin cobaltochelatase [Oscillospiraceae bacterium]